MPKLTNVSWCPDSDETNFECPGAIFHLVITVLIFSGLCGYFFGRVKEAIVDNCFSKNTPQQDQNEDTDYANMVVGENNDVSINI